MPTSPDDLTVLIGEARDGDAAARDRLAALIYHELRALARRSRHVGRAGETMQPTALANEAYLLFQRRFPVPPRDQPESRATFFRAVAAAMRTILRDHWRGRQALKRGGGAVTVALGAHDPAGGRDEEPLQPVDFLALDEALDRLERHNRRCWDVVMHRYLAGRTLEETAELMGIGVSTVREDWIFARAWLRRELGG